MGTRLRSGQRVTTPDGAGVVSYVDSDSGWCGVRIDGEATIHEWRAEQLVEVRS